MNNFTLIPISAFYFANAFTLSLTWCNLDGAQMCTCPFCVCLCAWVVQQRMQLFFCESRLWAQQNIITLMNTERLSGFLRSQIWRFVNPHWKNSLHVCDKVEGKGGGVWSTDPKHWRPYGTEVYYKTRWILQVIWSLLQHQTVVAGPAGLSFLVVNSDVLHTLQINVRIFKIATYMYNSEMQSIVFRIHFAIMIMMY